MEIRDYRFEKRSHIGRRRGQVRFQKRSNQGWRAARGVVGSYGPVVLSFGKISGFGCCHSCEACSRESGKRESTWKRSNPLNLRWGHCRTDGFRVLAFAGTSFAGMAATFQSSGRYITQAVIHGKLREMKLINGFRMFGEFDLQNGYVL